MEEKEDIEVRVIGTLYRFKLSKVHFYYCTNIGVFVYDSSGTWDSTQWTLDNLRLAAQQRNADFHSISKLQFLVETGKTFEESLKIEQSDSEEKL